MNSHYDRGFNSVLPFYRSDAGKPCGNSYIPASKKCKVGEGSLKKATRNKAKASDKTNEE